MLTDRQREIAELVARGLTNKAIARTVGISVGTVEAHVRDAATRLPCDIHPDLPQRRRIMLFFLSTEQDAA